MPAKPANKSNQSRSEKERDEYKRFVETARAVGASDDPKDFDRAFDAVTGNSIKRRGKRGEDS